MRRQQKQDFNHIKELLPVIIFRRDIEETLKSISPFGFTRRQFENLDFRGKGPKRIRIGKKIAYKRDDFIGWMENYVKPLM